MIFKLTISSRGLKPVRIGIAKIHKILLYSDRFIPESPMKYIYLLSDVPEVLEMYQTKVGSARLDLSEKPL